MSEAGTYHFVIPRFATWYIALSIAVPGLIHVLKMTTGLDLSSGGVSIIPMMLAAMNEGTQYARATQSAPKGKRAWQFAGLFALFGSLLTMLLAAMVLVSAPHLLGWTFRPSLTFIAVGGVVMILAYTLVGRLFFSLGAVSELKRQAAER